MPRLIKFSGIVKDSSGNPLNGSIVVVFRIYAHESDDTPLWQETQNVNFTDGRYSVLLGSATQGGIPMGLFQSGESQWFGVQALLDGEPEQRRTIVTSVPYALKASDADTVGGLPASAFIRAQLPDSAFGSDATSTGPAASDSSLREGTSRLAAETQISDDNRLAKFSGSSGLTASQVQDLGGVVHVQNLEHTIYANEMPGVDIGAQINASITVLGTKGGVVQVPAGTYNTVTTVVVNTPNVSVIGAGSNATIINYSGTGDFLRIQMRPYVGIQAGKFSGFTINLGVTSVSGIHIGDTCGAELDDIVINGPESAAGTQVGGGGTQAGVWFDNESAWTERTQVTRVHVNYVFKGFRFTTSGSNTSTSFGYTRFIDSRVNVGPNQKMISFEGGVLYNSSLVLLGNAVGGLGTTIISLSGTQVNGGSGSLWFDNWYQIQTEQTSGSGTVLFDVAPGTTLAGAGYIKGNAMDYGRVGGSVIPTLTYFGISGSLTGPSVISHASGPSPLYQGFGSNLQWGGNAYVAQADGFHNGGAAIMNRGPSSTEWEFYTMPTTSGTRPQMIWAKDLWKYRVAGFGNKGIELDRSTKIVGDLTITGNLAKSSGSFKIDHPLDPANKYLYHSFVESPDMLDIYNGIVVTDKHGYATVVLPTYFQALNRDFRYQLTPIGCLAEAAVIREISNNRFIIRTSKARVRVSWQVTGIRHDAYADAHRIPVEEEKPDPERGHYLHPELFDQREAVAKTTSSAGHN